MNNIPLVFWLIPIASVVALGMAWYFFRSMMKEEEGTDRMKEIAAAIHEGARAFLFAEYKILAIIIVIVFVAVGFAIGWTTALCFLIGAFFSIIAGFCGISTRNSVNRILRGLREANVITMVYQKILILDVDYLKQYIQA